LSWYLLMPIRMRIPVQYKIVARLNTIRGRNHVPEALAVCGGWQAECFLVQNGSDVVPFQAGRHA
ncbi:hypothetical protein COCVIDRAFT_108441, partial [Bipolaris victoriae FI3]